MAAHRYWRAQVQTAGALSLSEFHLIAGTMRVDASAALSSTVAPSTGALASLKDNDTATDATWASAAKLYFDWDFGVGGAVDVSDIRLGSTLSREAFPRNVWLYWSDSGTTWTLADVFGVILWPGFRAKTASEQLGNLLKARTLSQGNSTTSYTPTAPYLAFEVGDYGSVVVPPAVGGGLRQVEFVKTALINAGIAAEAHGFVTDEAIRTSNPNGNPTSGATPMSRAGSIAYYRSGNKYLNGPSTPYGASFTTSDVIGATLDFATGAVTFYKNGVSQGVAGAFEVGRDDIRPSSGVFGSSGIANRNVQVLRTRDFTYPISGATPWEARWRIATTSTGVSLERFGSTSRVDTLAQRAASAVLPIKAPHRLWRNFADPILGTGKGRLRGVTLDYVNPINKPYRCRVVLLREIDCMAIRAVWTGADGSYDFQYIDELQSYTVLAYYLNHGKQAVVADGLSLANGKVELMA